MNFDKVISRKGTYCTQWDYTFDRFGDDSVLPFSISDMDIPIPQSLQDVLIQRLQHPILGYSRWNHGDYKDAIKHWYLNRYQTNIESDWVIYSPSVMYSIAKCFQLVSEEHDGVTILTPAYNAFFEVIVNNKRSLLESPLKLINGHYEIDFEDFESKISKSKVFLLCNPHNPVGRMWSESEVQKMINIAKKYDCWIVSDDIHMDICLRSTPYCVLRDYAIYDKMIVLNSISKSFNVPALTGSYVVLPNTKEREAFEKMTRYTEFVNSPAILNVIATIHVYQQNETWLNELQLYLNDNVEFVEKYLQENFPQIKLIKPDATYLCWLDCRSLNLSDQDIQDKLVTKGRVGIMPGSAYGTDGEGFLRFHVGCPRSKVIDGLERIIKALQ